MYPLDNSDNPLESLFKRPSFQQIPDHHIQNPISSKLDDSPFFSNFPSPFFDEHELPLNQILMPPQNLLMNNCVAVADQAHEINNSDFSTKRASKLKGKADDQPSSNGIAAPPLRRRNLAVLPRKRTGKKDRHSKICTAQGIRDRRMRLSLQVARKFFDLQDLLGYDKASKTIEWLFSKSKKAIKELQAKDNPQRNNNNISISDAKSESFFSECEVLSGIDQENSKELRIAANNNVKISPLCITKDDIKRSQKPDMRESREKARARARCRTREKMMIKGLQGSSQWCKTSPNQDDFQKLGSSNNNPFEGIDDQERVSPYVAADYSSGLNQIADAGTIEKLLGSSTSSTITSCPNNISDYNCSAAASCCIDPNSNFNMGFLGNWDLFNNDRLNSSQFPVINQVFLPGNPNSVYSATCSTPNFPLFHQ